jgi:hypothetical protein
MWGGYPEDAGGCLGELPDEVLVSVVFIFLPTDELPISINRLGMTCRRLRDVIRQCTRASLALSRALLRMPPWVSLPFHSLATPQRPAFPSPFPPHIRLTTPFPRQVVWPFLDKASIFGNANIYMCRIVGHGDVLAAFLFHPQRRQGSRA